MLSIRSDDLQTSTVHLGFRLTCNQWVLVRTKPISAEHHNVYILPLFFIAWLVARSLPNRGDAICFELALAWKEVVGCSQNQSERTWEASPYGSADFRNQSWPSRCLIKKRKHVQYFISPWRMFCTTFPLYQSYYFSMSRPTTGNLLTWPTWNRQEQRQSIIYCAYVNEPLSMCNQCYVPKQKCELALLTALQVSCLHAPKYTAHIY